jgi:ABC-2 type transport system ATP-binding protein
VIAPAVVPGFGDAPGREETSVIEVRGLWRAFGRKVALEDVSMTVQRGNVVGLVGLNGAGKTTLIKHLLGLLKAQRGTVRLFGRDPAADPEGTLARIGYLAEENDLPRWMRVRDLLAFLKPFYPGWDDAHARELVELFELNPAAKIKALSKGQQARAGLVGAIAHRPELLLLDEPSSGLDPVVRRDILAAIIRTVADEGRSVLFSSHLLEEVERVADEIIMIHEGKIVVAGPLDQLRACHRVLRVRAERRPEELRAIPGVVTVDGDGEVVRLFGRGTAESLTGRITATGARVIDERPSNLSEIFLALAGQRAPKEERP